MISLSEYQKLSAAVEAKQQEAQRAQGAFEQASKQLKTDFDCDTIEAAKALLVTLEAKEQEAADAFNASLAEFKEEYGHVLNSN